MSGTLPARHDGARSGIADGRGHVPSAAAMSVGAEEGPAGGHSPAASVARRRVTALSELSACE